MKKLSITVSNAFIIPDIIEKLEANEWEIIIKYIADLLLNHDIKTHTTSADNIKQELKQSYDASIMNLRNKLEQREAALIQAHDKITQLNDSVFNEYENNKKRYDSIMIEERKQFTQQLQEKEAHYKSTIATLEQQLQNISDQLMKQHAQQMNERDAHYKATLEQQTQQITEKEAHYKAISEQTIKLYTQQITEKETYYKATIEQFIKQMQEKEAHYKDVLDKHTHQMNERDTRHNDISEQTIKLYTQQMQEKEAQYKAAISTLEQQLHNISDQIAKQYIQQIDDLKNTIIQNKLASDANIDKQIQSYKVQYDNIVKQHDKLDVKYNSLKTDIEKQFTLTLANRLKEKDTHYLQQIEDMRNTYKQSKDEIANEYKNKLLESEQKYQEFITNLKPMMKFYGGTNAEKGDIGEDLVMNLIKSSTRFVEAYIEDMSGQTARGDIYIKYKKIKCLIEVKNKQIIVKEDVIKFVRDIRDSASSEKQVNCGVFISLQTDIIPGRNRDLLQVEYIDNIPVIYTTVTSQLELDYIFICLERMVSLDNNSNLERDNLIQYLKDYHAVVIRMQEYFERSIKDKTREIKNLTKELESFNLTMTSIHDTYIKFATCEVKDETQESETESDASTELDISDPSALQKISDVYIELLINKMPCSVVDLCLRCNIDQAALNKLGGYQKITTDAKQAELDKIITESVIQKIIEYKKQNNEYPSREYLSKNNILSIRKLTIIGKIINSRKVMEYIWAKAN